MCVARKGNMVRASRTGEAMQTSLRGIANRARQEPKHRFNSLYGLLDEANLRDCYHRLNRRSAPGSDGVEVAEYGEALDSNVAELVERLKAGQYKAKLVRRVYIPKANGKKRALGLPATEDKLVQLAAARILTAIFEADFRDSSYGYRPGVSAHHAVQYLRQALQTRGLHHVVEADIKGFFDHIDHEWLLKMLRQRIADERFIGLITRWLKAGLLEVDGSVEHPESGSPQGGIISPVLANIYLHFVLDLWFEKVVRRHCRHRAILVRYADDFAVGFHAQQDAGRFLKALKGRLEKFKLELAEEKTRLMAFSQRRPPGQGAFEFLGFEFRWAKGRQGKAIVSAIMSPSRFRRTLRALTTWVKANRFLKLPDMMAGLSRKLTGIQRYFGWPLNYERLNTLQHQLKRVLMKWLNRRSQRRSYTWEGFKQMMWDFPLPKIKLTRSLKPRVAYVPS